MVGLLQMVLDRLEKNDRFECLDSQLKEGMLYDLAKVSVAFCSHRVKS